ncbi:hypothetical protein DW653_06565 [Phocaeicola plebeius]|uniref:Uncharacterized protein n=1 Tax=Phocaeicola plebeius TaxID=310297 RepID=A0A414REV5_9BACT|nr:hypothetical protein DW653_06565 [Phocaeicola plebeius]
MEAVSSTAARLAVLVFFTAKTVRSSCVRSATFTFSSISTNWLTSGLLSFSTSTISCTASSPLEGGGSGVGFSSLSQAFKMHSEKIPNK